MRPPLFDPQLDPADPADFKEAGLVAETNAGSNLPTQSVSDISKAVKKTVEQAFDRVRVRGEISRPTYARSGHLYLTLKDEKAVLDAVAWRGMVAKFDLKAEEGMEVVVEGRLTTFPGSSKYQLVMDRMSLAGQGALLKLLEDRKKKLAAEGLFEPDRKKPLPYLPKTIAVVTSPTGAVIRDILHRLRDRFPCHVLVWPVAVQGQTAAGKIAAAIRGLDALVDQQASLTQPNLACPDLIIVARGGGSLEDLWCFNEESVVRAVADCRIPLISAIGHETDTTLIDFVADQRAPTPTAAAEMAVPVREALAAYLDESQHRVRSSMRGRLARAGEQVSALSRGLISPEKTLETMAQTLDHACQRQDQAMKHHLDRADRMLVDLAQRLPGALRQQARQAEHSFRQLNAMDRMKNAFARTVKDCENQTRTLNSQLLSFEQAEVKALERGYARVWDKSGKLITSQYDLPVAEPIELEFHDGRRAWPSLDAGAVDLPQSRDLGPVTAKPDPAYKGPAKPRKTSEKNPNQGSLF